MQLERQRCCPTSNAACGDRWWLDVTNPTTMQLRAPLAHTTHQAQTALAPVSCSLKSAAHASSEQVEPGGAGPATHPSPPAAGGAAPAAAASGAGGGRGRPAQLPGRGAGGPEPPGTGCTGPGAWPKCFSGLRLPWPPPPGPAGRCGSWPPAARHQASAGVHRARCDGCEMVRAEVVLVRLCVALLRQLEGSTWLHGGGTSGPRTHACGKWLQLT